MRIADLARRPELPLWEIFSAAGLGPYVEEMEWADIEFKYAGYLARERSAAARLSQMESFALPDDLEYHQMTTLAFEAREKLHALKPATLGQAGRVPGISPSDLHSLVLEVTRRKLHGKAVSRETQRPPARQ
jgi:tRNA uridine 5-carboxymethylaminomethyl modification enzyme